MSLNLHDKSLLKTKALLNGEWQPARSGQSFDVKNPATDEVIASVAKCAAAETKSAIEFGEAAFASWRALTAKERASYLMAWHDLVFENVEDLAQILTAEQGKPLAESRGEILYGANYIKWFAEEAKRVYGDTIPGQSAEKRVIVIKQPIGVVACITPWNFPNAMLARKIAPALAALSLIHI